MTEAYPSNNQKLDRQFQKSDWWEMRLRLQEDIAPRNPQLDAASVALDAHSGSIPATDLSSAPNIPS